MAASEALALATCLNLWLREVELAEVAPPANVRFTYGENGNLKTVYVTLGGD